MAAGSVRWLQRGGHEGSKAVIKDRPGGRERHNLPVHRTGLIGRDQDVVVGCQAVLESEGHLVTLTGVGGCRKTRLALQVGRDLVDAFDHGCGWRSWLRSPTSRW